MQYFFTGKFFSRVEIVTTPVQKEKKKKLNLEEEVKDLMNASEKLSNKAEMTGKVSFVNQANSLRRTAKDKKMEIEKIDDKIKSALN